jgi:hypothetical protein
MTWKDDVRASLERLGGRAHLREIYNDVRTARKRGGRSLPASLEAIVRGTLETHSADSDAFKGRGNLFHMAEGKGAGVWALVDD